MQLKTLIAKLQELYDSYGAGYIDVMGEPEIVIDVFEKLGNTHTFEYMGWTPNIVIEKSDCGCYDILSCFYENKDSGTKTAQPVTPCWPFPPCGKT